ncbi:MAG: DUF6751 family protein [Pseudoflavonifractor sp.]
MLGCDKTVTLVRCDGESYTTTIIVGVSWFDKARIKLEGEGLAFANATAVRIPAAAVPAILPKVGDTLILGAVTRPLEKPADLAAYRHVKIMAVGDNRRGGRPHVGLTCQ